MEPEQTGAVESPGSLLSHPSVPGLHGLHGLCARFARFIQRPQTPRNPDQAGVGGARKPAALIPCLLPPFPLTPATKPAPQLKGAYAPPPLGD